MDPAEAAWSLEHHLLARTVEALEGGNWQRAGKKTAPRPEPIRRPGVGPARTTLSESEIMIRLKAQRARQARRTDGD